MKRVSAAIVAGCLAGSMMFAAPAKAFYPDPGDLLFRFVSGDWFFLFYLSYSDEAPQSAGQSPTEDCASGAPVKMERLKDGDWIVVQSGKTNKKGKFKELIKPAKPGKYRAHVLAYTTPDNNDCFEGYGKPKRFKKE